MTLVEILLEQNYLHSLIQNGIDVEANSKKMETNYNNPLLVNSRVQAYSGVLEPSGYRIDGYSFKIGNDILELELHNDDKQLSNIGSVGKVVHNIVGEVYITDTHLYLVYRRNENNDMSRSLSASYVKAKIVPGPSIF